MVDRVKRWLTNLPKRIWERKFSILFWVIILSVGGLVVYWALYADDSPFWTGFGAYDEEKNGPRAKTLWDWMELLIVPAVLVLAAWWINKSERERDARRAAARIREERERSDDRQREERLQTYFDRMAELLLKEDLRSSEPLADVQEIARAHTLITLQGLDGDRKGLLLRFLCEARLINSGAGGVVPMNEADLSGANLGGVNLCGANLPQVDLREANLSFAEIRGIFVPNVPMVYFAKLCEADLRRANLTGADLTGANLQGADLREANMTDSILIKANLTDASINNEQLAQVRSLEEAIMPDGMKYEEWARSHPEFLAMRGETPTAEEQE